MSNTIIPSSHFLRMVAVGIPSLIILSILLNHGCKNQKQEVFETKFDNERVIIIDAGHGGDSKGAIGHQFYKNLYEKDINLSIAKKLKNILLAKYQVVMTREDDKFVSLQKRCKIANNSHGDLFVSIHANGDNNPHLYGAMVLAENETNMKIADIVAKKLQKPSWLSITITWKRRDLHVLNNTKCPAILIETGFMTNKHDAGKLSDETYQEKVAISIAEGIDEAFKNLSISNGRKVSSI